MKYSYDYEELIGDINEDIDAGIISPNDTLKVIRKRKAVSNNYHPIIDYYYSDNLPEQKHEVMLVKDVLQELVYHHMLTK
ncbi:hypothetical protein [Acetobacterium tundrae]|uniref:Uncharacterized protein n=1 Tax=Acetobacterium tundrae TaxID=132932 RepID=A0ABR6WLT6_9FIRM|nr:hypothetical protein [Acetobacterium tundrae]MBC3797475.1 hypothetical protein [Acetobacterium tundrae]